MATLTSVDEQIRELKERQAALEKIKTSYNGAINYAQQLMGLTQDNPDLRQQFWEEFDSVRNGNGTSVATEEDDTTTGEVRIAEVTGDDNTTLLKSMSVDRLRNLADRLKIRTLKSMTKPQLVEAISQVPREKIERYIAKV